MAHVQEVYFACRKMYNNIHKMYNNIGNGQFGRLEVYLTIITRKRMFDIEDSDDLLYVQNTTGSSTCSIQCSSIYRNLYIVECFYVHTLVIQRCTYTNHYRGVTKHALLNLSHVRYLLKTSSHV